MADEEQFSMCWDNFNTNLSAGFHESLFRGDLVDVTLAAEGQLVKAHRLVLSVCSPYFRKMFTQMPANQHAFVFLKDVSSSALKDLIQFMYCGEVNIKQEALPAFISTAEALQIKGLTESNEGTTAAAGSASPTKEVVTSTPHPEASQQRPRTTRIAISRPQALKIQSEGKSDEKQTVTLKLKLVQTAQPIKRIARQSITGAAPKRVKITQAQDSADPLELTLDEPEHEIVTPQHLKVSESIEFIDLPIEATQLSTKTEPEYVEETQEIETEQDEDQYVEETAYGDESYFEGDDKAGVSGSSETYATEGDQSATEAQEFKKMSEKSRKKPVFLTLAQKKEIIDVSETGVSGRELGRQYGIDKNTVGRVLKAKDGILEEYGQNTNPDRKRSIHSTRHGELNRKVYELFVACRAKNIPVTGPLLQEEARVIAAELGVNGFVASNGWLEKFRTRYNIQFKTRGSRRKPSKGS